ncbi:MAG: GtrA family protein [Chloroflexi bacterium]|nr:GtrA family protein [Chloroflexota bacterium]
MERQADQSLPQAGVSALQAIGQRFPMPAMFAKFLIVGGIAYLINQLALFLLYDSPVFWFLPAKDTEFLGDPDVRLLISSILAVEVSIIFQFNSHERWTFRGRSRKGPGIVRFLKFNLTSAVSPIIVVVTVNTLTPIFDISPYVSNTIGILIGFIWNWGFNTLLIWPRQQVTPAEGPQ